MPITEGDGAAGIDFVAGELGSRRRRSSGPCGKLLSGPGAGNTSAGVWRPRDGWGPDLVVVGDEAIQLTL